MNKPEYIILHHTGGTDAKPLADSSNYTVAQCNADHKIRFPSMKSSLGYYVGYHHFIDKKGTVTQCRADTDEGAHTVGYNSKSIGICLAGNFDATVPTKEQEQALKGLIASYMTKYSIPLNKVVPHRTFAKKTCYGNKLPDDWGQKLVSKKEVPIPQAAIEPTEESCIGYIEKKDSNWIIAFIQKLFGIIRNK